MSDGDSYGPTGTMEQYTALLDEVERLLAHYEPRHLATLRPDGTSEISRFIKRLHQRKCGLEITIEQKKRCAQMEQTDGRRMEINARLDGETPRGQGNEPA